ncbi:MAG TPA: type II toxin-antitoxin system prevent-host-death family antitoxin [Bryobacteraceae bacterium]|jgi:prevent-host-death family protein|nr:type II toxin-antitoxin system prevent-host-death family antitoxin [Bryobacteraceae bacterium]
MVFDHGTVAPGDDMEQIAVSKFKATCLAVLERVRKTRKPVLVTRFGVPLAEVVPPSEPKRRSNWLGAMAGTGEIIGDIESPISSEDEWDAGRK